MQHFILCFGLMMSSSLLFAQTFDAQKMNKDIGITEKMLESYSKEAFGGTDWEETVQGTYIEDYGVVFTIRTSASVYAIPGIRITRPESSIKGLPMSRTVTIESGKKDESPDMTAVIKKKQIATAFLSNYATLIRQLKTQDKILLNFVDDFQEYFPMEWENGRLVTKCNQTILTAEVFKKDIEEFRTKKINEEEFTNRVAFKETNKDNISNPDIDRLITIFEELHSVEETGYKISLIVKNQYTYIENLGVVISFDLHDHYEYPEYPDNDEANEQEIQAIEQKRAQILKDNFNAFLKTFKENIVEYGRTVKSIQPNEMLIFKLQTYFWDDNHVEVSVKRSTLDDYDQQKITLEQAIEKVKVNRN